MKSRLDVSVLSKGLVVSRSQAESYVRLGKVKVNGRVVTKPGAQVSDTDKIELTQDTQYVGRAGLKLESVSRELGLECKDKVVLDIGSSTGGFTDFALKNGAKKVIAVELGKNQLHPSLRGNPKIELHEQTDILSIKKLSSATDIVLMDLSFISLREILPHVSKLVNKSSLIVAMVKPQFEARNSNIKHKGVIKNEKMRREILKDFEIWVKQKFVVVDKKDSGVAGQKGNRERFYVLQKLS